jgi:hypothetical protein
MIRVRGCWLTLIAGAAGSACLAHYMSDRLIEAALGSGPLC